MTADGDLGSIGAGIDLRQVVQRRTLARRDGLYFLECAVILVRRSRCSRGVDQTGHRSVFSSAACFWSSSSLTVNSTHSIVGAAAPMDIGGKKMAGLRCRRDRLVSILRLGDQPCSFSAGCSVGYGWSAWYPLMVLFALSGGVSCCS